MEPSGDMKNKESRVGNMAVRDEIIKTLEENRGTYLSGEQLAKKLSVSRAAVWKAIRKLQEDGFAIEGVNNKGYKLAEDTDVSVLVLRWLLPVPVLADDAFLD